ncbi:MAG TPA: class I SAM-dependent methyltransferase [Solirubrobacteraceae bacterium]|nr:class I SAM-dependent methyltransferase [Solirubrobacteraceae bacterium]
MRAAHTRHGLPLLLADPWGDRLVLDRERDALRTRSGHSDLDAALRAHPSFGTVILRARYAEDALAEAVRRGVAQYVIVGAGLDSFALRRPPFARELEIFEIDHPSTQQLKTQRLAACGHWPLPRVQLIAADLSEVGLDAVLAGTAFSGDAPAFFSWLGVTAYLTREANLATLRAIASCAPASELVFSYIDKRLLDADGGHDGLQRAREQVASVGEPWVSGFDPDGLAADLRGTGLELMHDLGPAELAERYCAGRDDGLQPSVGAHVAHARVVA